VFMRNNMKIQILWDAYGMSTGEQLPTLKKEAVRPFETSA